MLELRDNLSKEELEKLKEKWDRIISSSTSRTSIYILKEIQMTPIYTSLTFWTLVAGLVVYVAQFFAPSFPFTQDQILAFFVFVLGLVNVVPTFIGKTLTATDLVHSKAFWATLVGVIGFAVRYYLPIFPLSDTEILGAVIFVLGLFNIVPELRARTVRLVTKG